MGVAATLPKLSEWILPALFYLFNSVQIQRVISSIQKNTDKVYH